MQENSDKNKTQNNGGLISEHDHGELGQIILLILFLVVWSADSYIFYFSTTYQVMLPVYIRILIAFVILIISAYLVSTGIKYIFSGGKKSSGLVKTGIYSKIRHPIYLGSILFYLGFIILTFSILSIATWFVIVIFYNYIALYEEKILQKRYGNEYLQYKKQVPRWIPKIV
ncbi:MAG: isoprenylcysteine carboxylmethyltransferase family protein [Bacteroidales bacterium]|nr:isoprenylcysteine carboxylmethyltransferase family protein [Bacteroidales bacterium]